MRHVRVKLGDARPGESTHCSYVCGRGEGESAGWWEGVLLRVFGKWLGGGGRY
jgi:hypothetical protein